MTLTANASSGNIYTNAISGSVGAPPPGTGWTNQISEPQCVDPACTECDNVLRSEISQCSDQACVESAQAKYAGCIRNLTKDRIVQASRQTTKVIPLPPTLTSNGSAQITVSSQQVGGQPLLGNLIMMTAGFYGDTHFIMNQTSSTFRPRDARDAAANCAANSGGCNPQYTVQFACNSVLPVNGRLGNPRDPVFVAGVGGWAPPVGFASRNRKGWLHPILPFTSYTPPCPQLPAKYTFQLAPQTQWLVGTSTNLGDDTDRDPDYLFEQIKNPMLAAPQNGGLLITTPGFVTGSQGVTVTSRDFGGAGQLRASATFQDSGLTFDADIVDTEKPGSPQVLPPSGACGAAFRQYPFASLPVDQDCNSLADSWEKKYPRPGNLPLCGDREDCHKADNEVGFGAPRQGQFLGDGFSAFDEYRGFHVVDPTAAIRTPSVKTWIDTDPLNVKDVLRLQLTHLMLL